MNIVVSLLALIGLLNAGYILRSRVMKKPLSCPLHGNCKEITESKWGKVLGVHNDFMGMIYFFFVVVLGLMTFGFVDYAIIIVTGFGLLYSGYLFYVQSRILREYCFYCLISALITLLMFVFAWF